MIKAIICGCHVYKEVWCASVREELSCMRKVENYRNLFTVAVVRSGIIVGHVPSLAVSLDALKQRHSRRRSSTTTN